MNKLLHIARCAAFDIEDDYDNMCRSGNALKFCAAALIHASTLLLIYHFFNTWGIS